METGKKPEPSRQPPSFFKVMIGDFSDHLLIPPAFVKHFGGVIPQELVLRTCAGRERRVSVMKVNKKLFLKTGWNLFVKDNFIDSGDFLVFQHAGKLGFDVKIFERRTGCGKNVTVASERSRVIHAPTLVDTDHTGDESGLSSDRDRFRSTECQHLPDNFFKQSIQEETEGPGVECMTQMRSHSKVRTAIQGMRAVEAANHFISNLPFFKVVITNSYLRFLRVPRSFAKQNMKKVEPRIMLQVSNRSWPVKFTFCGNFSSGWMAFVKDNALQKGDVCIFELNRGKKAVMKVSIFRCAG